MARPGLRYFVDENLTALGKALVSVRNDVVYPGHPRLPEVPAGTADTEWLTVVGSLDLLVLSRDKRMRHRPAERRAILDSGVRVVFLGGSRNLDRWAQLDLVVRSWPRLEEARERTGPWVASLTMGSLKVLPTSYDGRS